MNSDLLSVALMLGIIQVFLLCYGRFGANLRPILLKLGVLNSKMERLHKQAMKYYKFGVPVPPELMVEPNILTRKERRRLYTKLILEICSYVVILALPSGILVSLN